MIRRVSIVCMANHEVRMLSIIFACWHFLLPLQLIMLVLEGTVVLATVTGNWKGGEGRGLLPTVISSWYDTQQQLLTVIDGP